MFHLPIHRTLCKGNSFFQEPCKSNLPWELTALFPSKETSSLSNEDNTLSTLDTSLLRSSSRGRSLLSAYQTQNTNNAWIKACMQTKPKKFLRHQWNQGQTKICKKCKQVITQNPGHHLLAVWLFNWRAFLFYWSQIHENNIFSFERLFYQPNSQGSFSFSALYSPYFLPGLMRKNYKWLSN